jgi:hypothetical protein
MENPDRPPSNPYAAPAARVDDPSAAGNPGNFSPEGVRVPASHGVRWIVEGFGIYKTYPVLWIGFAFAFTVINVILGIIPVLGGIASFVLLPVWIAGPMFGCQAIMTGAPLRFAHLFSGFAANAGRLMAFGFMSFVMFTAIMIVSVAVGFGLVAATSMEGTLASPIRVLLAVLIFLSLLMPFAMVVWFGPPLIALSGQSVGSAARGSFAACLKNMLPLTVYGAIFLVYCILVGVVAGVIAGVVGFGVDWSSFGARMPTPGDIAGMMGGVLALTLVSSTLTLPFFFTTLYACFRDIFYRP